MVGICGAGFFLWAQSVSANEARELETCQKLATSQFLDSSLIPEVLPDQGFDLAEVEDWTNPDLVAVLPASELQQRFIEALKLLKKDFPKMVSEYWLKMRFTDEPTPEKILQNLGRIAIYGYTSSDAWILNGGLWNQCSNVLPQLRGYIEALSLGLSELPKFDGIDGKKLHRNLPLLTEDLEQYRVQETVLFRGFTSTATSWGNFGGKVNFEIHCSVSGVNVKSFSQAENENEILFPARTNFRILQKVGKKVIMVEDVEACSSHVEAK